MNTQLLKEIGLTEGEAKVYMALLELGTTTTGPVVKKSGISASKVYEILNKLTDKGLVSHVIKAKTKHFRPADPERIIDYLDEKEKEIASKKEEMRKLIPELKAKLGEKEKREAEVLEGRKGIENIFYSIISELKKGEEYYVMGASYGEGMKYLKDFFQEYHTERAKRGVKVKLLFNYDVKTIVPATRKLGEIRFMPQNVKTPIQIVIWKDKVTTIMWQERPIAFTINNKNVADSYKIYFDSYWNQKTKTYKGFDAFKKAWIELQEEGDILYFIGAKGYYFDRRLKDAMEIVDIAKKKGMKWKNIVDENTRGHIITKVNIAETRYFKENITAPGVIWICGGRMMISNWAKNEPIVVVIDNKEIADSYRNYFEILWGMAKP